MGRIRKFRLVCQNPACRREAVACKRINCPDCGIRMGYSHLCICGQFEFRATEMCPFCGTEKEQSLDLRRKFEVLPRWHWRRIADYIIGD